VVTAVSAATAGASALPVETQASEATRPDTTAGGATTTASTARSGANLRAAAVPRSRFPVFVLDKGRFSAFDAPGQGSAEFQRINNRGEVVGSYTKQQLPADDVLGGYRRDRRGRITRFDLPGAASTTPLDSRARSPLGRRRWAGCPERWRP
jgi:hypothetical protein